MAETDWPGDPTPTWEDPMREARGCANGLALVALIWLGLGVAWWLLR